MICEGSVNPFLLTLLDFVEKSGENPGGDGAPVKWNSSLMGPLFEGVSRLYP